MFFRLRVAGLRGKGFNQWKLRTMIEEARVEGAIASRRRQAIRELHAWTSLAALEHR